jgi:F-type H+-transporting ATPase subunit gamma
VPGAGVKALNKRIRSVKSTQQITKAMKMVAAAKLNRSQSRMLAARPYAHKLTALVQQLAGAVQDSHPLFDVRDIHRRLFVVVTSDKGLCGSYNINILKLAQRAVDESRDAGVETELITVGKKAGDFFSKRGYTVRRRHDHFNGEATAQRGQMLGDELVGLFVDGTVDEIRLVYAEFHSTMIQRPGDQCLLPIAADAIATKAEHGGAVDYIWEPDQQSLLATLLPLYLRNRVFVMLLEAFTSEHAARMTSMTAATDNAAELIDNLTLRRNRERQSAITAELLDIVGGANAL